MAKTWEANLTALRVHRDVPDGKDWNDDLIKLKAAIAAGTAEKDHYTYSTAHIYKNESRPSFLKAEDYIEIDEDGDKPLTIYDMGFEPNY
jgi:hypothetical protein